MTRAALEIAEKLAGMFIKNVQMFHVNAKPSQVYSVFTPSTL